MYLATSVGVGGLSVAPGVRPSAGVANGARDLVVQRSTNHELATKAHSTSHPSQFAVNIILARSVANEIANKTNAPSGGIINKYAAPSSFLESAYPSGTIKQ